MSNNTIGNLHWKIHLICMDYRESLLEIIEFVCDQFYIYGEDRSHFVGHYKETLLSENVEQGDLSRLDEIIHEMLTDGIAEFEPLSETEIETMHQIIRNRITQEYHSHRRKIFLAKLEGE